MKISNFQFILKVIILVFLFNTISLLADDDIVFIPDSAFKAVLLNHWPTIDTNGDGKIQVSEAEAFDPHGETLKAYGEGVHDLTGIKAFINADWVITGGELITEIDVTGMENWLFLEIYYSNITELDLEGCTSLSTLQCNNNSNLTSIEISDCVDLRILDIDGNDLKEANVFGISGLTTFSMRNNQIENINIKHLKQIYYLYCGKNELHTLVFPENSDLYFYEGSENKYTDLDFSTSPNLISLNVHNNQLNKLNLKNGNNQNMNTKYFDVTNNPNLKCVDVDDPHWSEENWREYFDDDVVFSLDCKSCIEEKAEKSFRVYPNPTKDYVYVNRYSDRASKLSIIDISGRVCQEVDLPQGQHEVLIDIDKLSSGCYIIDIDDAIEMLVVE